MRLIDFLTEYGEAVEDAKEQQKKNPPNRNKTVKTYRPKRHR